MTTGNQ